MYCVYIYQSDNQINNSGGFDFASSLDISEIMFSQIPVRTEIP